MAENLLPDNFVQGMVIYIDRLPDREDSRIVVRVSFGGQYPTLAVIDTAAPYCILNPEEAGANGDVLNLDFGMNIRGIIYRGTLQRIPVELQASTGSSIRVEATVFVANLEPGQSWPLPNFLGLTGFLERLRFAADPSVNAFYFGKLDD